MSYDDVPEDDGRPSLETEDAASHIQSSHSLCCFLSLTFKTQVLADYHALKVFKGVPKPVTVRCGEGVCLR